jgi:plastocyanin
MANILLSGVLKRPNGDIAVGDQIKFEHKSSTGDTVQTAECFVTIPPNGQYYLSIEYGIVNISYKAVTDEVFTNLGKVTVNQDNPATNIPELLRATVPQTNQEMLEFQTVLANCIDAQNNADQSLQQIEALTGQQTTTELINSSTVYDTEKVLETSGFTTAGDGGSGKWKQNGVTGQTPSQTPVQLVDGLLNDANGNQWALVFSDDVAAKKLGVVGDSLTDDILALRSATAYAESTKKPLNIRGLRIRTSKEWVVPRDVEVLGEGSVIQRFGSNKDFKGVHIPKGNGTKSVFGTIDGYDDGIYIETNVSDITFKTISNCNRGFIIAADSSNNLDNKVTGVQIGFCDEAIVFEQNGLRTQQGNEVRVNFVSQCKHTLVFDDKGTHSGGSNWDSNFVELMASDPLTIQGATFFWNKSLADVPNLIFEIKTWAGGWDSSASTIDLLYKGKAVNSNFGVNLAQYIPVEKCLDPSRDWSSCTFNTYRLPLYSSTVEGITTTNKNDYNLGRQSNTMKVNVVNTLSSNLDAGIPKSINIFHSFASGSNVVENVSAEMQSNNGKITCYAVASNIEENGLIRVWITNISNTTILAGTTIRFTVTFNSNL